MKLSIITINYNNLDGLKKTVQSVIKQSYKDYEWIVIDGGSTDGSKEYLDEKKEYFSYYVSERDSGIYNAMNKGTLKARGEFCQYLNSGDYFVDDTVLEKVFSTNNFDCDVYYGDVDFIKKNVVIEHRTYPDKMSLTFLFRSPLGHQASFIRTSAAKSIMYNEKYTISGDRYFFLALYGRGYSFCHLKFPIVFFDAEGIGSSLSTIEKRRVQLRDIKNELFSEQVVKDIENLIECEDNYKFVCRVKPLYFVYKFFRFIQKIKYKIH